MEQLDWIARQLTDRTLDPGIRDALVEFVSQAAGGQDEEICKREAVAIILYHLLARHEQEVEDLMWVSVTADTSSLGASGRQTLETIELLGGLTPPDEGGYPKDPYGFGPYLRDVAALIKADVGLEVACIDFGGWDLHKDEGQGGDPDGTLSNLLSALGDGLAALAADLDARMNGVTVVVMTEFGRQLPENSSAGTDHGRGGLMLTLGRNVVGGQVFVNPQSEWEPLLSLRGRGEIDLPVMTDYRDILGEILRVRMSNELVEQVFPDYLVTAHGLVLPG